MSQLMADWHRAFDDPISVPDGRVLKTLHDAGLCATALPKAYRTGWSGLKPEARSPDGPISAKVRPPQAHDNYRVILKLEEGDFHDHPRPDR